MSKKVVPITAAPVRRSGFINTAPPHLQSEFINAARAAMGQPGEEEVERYFRRCIKITFNGGRLSVTGTLTDIIKHPSTVGATYLVLDHDQTRRYSLNSIQSIELVQVPELTEGEDESE